MSPAATVESTTAATVEAAADVTVEAASTGEAAPNHTMSAGIRNWSSYITRSSVAIAGTPINRPSIIAAAVAVVAAIAVVIPRPGADKDTAGEPRGTVIAIRRASVRIIPVVAVSANRRIPVSAVSRSANSDANRDLGMGVSSSGDQQNTE
jgi:hypothetical protein